MTRAAPSPKRAEHTPAGVPDAYARFAAHADRLAAPLVALMQDGESTLPIQGRASNHGDEADRLEAFARPFLLIALWLRACRARETWPTEAERAANWCRAALALGTTPGTDRYWGTLTNFHQHAVEMAILTMALDIAEDDIWTPMPEDDRQQVLSWLAQIRGHGGHRNNHLFFDILTLEYLAAKGYAQFGDDAAIRHHLDTLESMHRADGWFIDGGNESYDHYNAYAFHIYALWWAHRFGHRDPAIAKRWTDLAAQFLPSYAALFAPTGEPLPIGRSLTYRFNGLGVFPLAALHDIDNVPLAESRDLCERCLDFFLSKPIAQTQGCLSVGWVDEFPELAEPYTCAGSPYWAAKGLLMLALPPDHPFFRAHKPDAPAARTAASTVRAPGWTVRTRNTQTELLCAGGGCSLSAADRFGAWKWSKLSYRTALGGLWADAGRGWPADAGLTARAAGEWVGRHAMVPVLVAEDHLVSQYQLGKPYGDLNIAVRTHLWSRGPWVLAVHILNSYQPADIRHGGFASPEAIDRVEQTNDRAAAHGTRWWTSIHALAGFSATTVEVVREGEPRGHTHGPEHTLPLLTGRVGIGPAVLAVVFGADPADEPGAEVRWSVAASATGSLELAASDGDRWTVAHPDLPVLPVREDPS